MTIDELNALYEAADFGNLGNYKAPTTTSNIDLTTPVVEGIPAIQPYIPFIINQGEGKGPTEDPPTDPMSFGQNDIPGYNQLNIAGPVKGPGILESLLSLPGQAIKAYMKYGPLGQVKRGIEFVKEKQRVAAENQRLAAAEEQSAREAATAARAMAANPDVYRNAGITSGGFASQNTGSNQNFSNKTGRGRTGYGTGGIVTL
tara:strand:- start:12 stop:617 length:606 start_codon:yes stop_codon:yes gene_type:complete